MKKPKFPIRPDQTGAAAVEFALLLPILLVLIFGIIEFSILFYDKAMITNASREGARAGIVYKENRYDEDVTDQFLEDDIKGVVNTYLSNYLINLGGISSPPNIIISGVKGARGDRLTVTVDYDYSFLVFSNVIKLLNAASGSSFPTTLELSAQTVMRLE